MLTLVFATYAVVLVPTLLVFGRLSDRLGRRRVIFAGLGAAAVAAALFAAAGGTAWLFAARAIQGLALAMAGGGANAGLVGLEPRHDARRAALLATLGGPGRTTGDRCGFHTAVRDSWVCLRATIAASSPSAPEQWIIRSRRMRWTSASGLHLVHRPTRSWSG